MLGMLTNGGISGGPIKAVPLTDEQRKAAEEAERKANGGGK